MSSICTDISDHSDVVSTNKIKPTKQLFSVEFLSYMLDFSGTIFVHDSNSMKMADGLLVHPSAPSPFILGKYWIR